MSGYNLCDFKIHFKITSKYILLLNNINGGIDLVILASSCLKVVILEDFIDQAGNESTSQKILVALF